MTPDSRTRIGGRSRVGLAWLATAAAVAAAAATAIETAAAAETAAATATATAAAEGGAAAPVPACEARSAPHVVALVELYTSQGCSSCPPADRWLSALRRSALYPGQAIPLAMHVDYWDYLGWRDPFASAAHTRRQREQARRTPGGGLYTPQVVVDGRDFRAWHAERQFVAELARVNARPSLVALRIDARRERAARDAHGARLRGVVSVAPAQAGGRAAAGSPPRAGDRAPLHGGDAVYLALIEDGRNTRVARGENAGVRLENDRIVRRLLGPLSAADGTDAVRVDEPWPEGLAPSRAGLVAWVQGRDGEILQAVDCAFDLGSTVSPRQPPGAARNGS